MFAEALHEDVYRSFRDRLSVLLEIPIDASDSDIHELIDAGFTANRITLFCELGRISHGQRDQIIALKTLNSRLALDQKLTVDESDRLFRHAYIVAMTETLFGSNDKARSWLSKPKSRFSGKTPVAMLSSTSGFRQVEELLIQISEGIAF
ncbi:DUF2384 domain-containing protein [Pseudomonas sp. C1C7]|uniref:antitoxin Xre/MbcA/ParS toxin-binding domain-containing protein n=1 Tax=Pseudomonas sp. C1C7 TaxID=2735272 RepID=UPI00158644A4|nr:antitoxin Xre/MbcA/ParS toxin-binding domain-containing protein [Pseudomonas sp. C1C7]NUT76837.1 DUF2384 domain-containing protein [Pseudomonas sp. C1C7]